MIERRYRLAVALGLVVAGIVVAVVGYLGVSRETEVAFQLPYFASAGVGALLLFGAGGVLLLGTQLERDDSRIAELEEAVRLLATELDDLADGLEPSGHRAGTRPNGKGRGRVPVRSRPYAP